MESRPYELKCLVEHNGQPCPGYPTPGLNNDNKDLTQYQKTVILLLEEIRDLLKVGTDE